MATTKNKKSGLDTGKKPSSKGLTAEQIVRRKVRDKNTKITEDDMKNVRIDSSLPEDEAHQPLPIPSKSERPKDEDKDNKMSTPWDVISE